MGEMRIDLQKVIYVPGDEINGYLHVSLDKPISQRSATLSLTGKERTEVTYHAGKSQATAKEESEFLRQESQLPLPTNEKGRLKPGDYTIPFRFTLPEELPGTYEGTNAKIIYEIAAKIDVPNAFDIRDSFEITVVSGFQEPTSASGPVEVCSDAWDDQGAAGLRLSLGGLECVRGRVLSGRCAFRNPGTKNLRKIDLSLKWAENAAAEGHEAKTDLDMMEQTVEIPLGGRVLKGENAFSIQIPEEAPLTFERTLFNVRCVLTAGLDISMGQDVAASTTLKVVDSPVGAKVLPPRPLERRSDFAVGIPQKPYQNQYTGRREKPSGTGRRPAVRCPSCGATLEMPSAEFCPYCGAKIPAEPREIAAAAKSLQVKIKKSTSPKAQETETCTVCGGELKQRDDVVWCPHCGKLAHRQHLIDWIRSNKTCPACGKSLNEKDYK
jgi:predicted RNA-binding Zn-ribbon protein involved in translation (DUF1610 family)/sporulation-control protein spo0M